jgi:4-hydroxybenzoate polyprenyltransferase
MPPELQILRDVASYRLRRLEMANLAGAAAIMLALRLPALEIAVRLCFGAVLNLLVYLNNDWCDREDDAAAAGREQDKTGFLREHPAAAVRAQLYLSGLLAGFAVIWGGGLGRAFVLGAGICWAYSAWWKRRPFVDVLAMTAWGFAMPMIAVPPGADAGWPLLVQLALFSGAFETIQVVRDHDEDRERGVQTTAVVLGPALTQRLTRLFCLLSAIWAGAAFHPLFALPALLASAMPMPPSHATRTWNRLRVLFGIVLVAECALVWSGGMS